VIHIFYGEAHGKSAAAIGLAFKEAALGRSVVVIQFLKQKPEDLEYLKRLEPEMKVFRFEKNDHCFDELSPECKQEEIINIKNGLNFARKVLSTRECDVVVLDEVLGLIDEKIIDAEDIRQLKEAADEDAQIILTGRVLSEDVAKLADTVCEMNVR